MSVAIILLSTGMLPLDIKAFLIALLAKEWRHTLSYLSYRTSDFSLHIDGQCHWQGTDYHIRNVLFHSPIGFVLDVEHAGRRTRLPLIYDAFSKSDFRHISRICLELKE
ncbi:protein YgfX [Enterovibrio coralii]|uniref:protein YgfX n=1 Tax=Enterovibrio coralii TaxID=294935 RepID=UPI000AA0592D